LVEDQLEEYADKDLMECFGLIRKSGDRIIRTTDLLLNLSEIQVGSYQKRINVFNLADEVLRKIYEKYLYTVDEKKVTLEFIIETPNSSILADAFTVEQIFIQLLDNAFKYTPTGKILIRVTENPDNKIIAEVKDSGIGISDEYLEKLFTPFSQEQMGYTRRYEGNGIGLALVKEYCKLNNATIKVESSKGKGTSIMVVFEKVGNNLI